MPSAIAAVFLQRFFSDFLIRISGFMAYKHTFFVRKLLFLYNFHLDLANLKSDLRFCFGINTNFVEIFETFAILHRISKLSAFVLHLLACLCVFLLLFHS